MKHLHEGHRQRVRDKIEKSGFDALQEHEILEFVLFQSIPRGDTNPIAHELINKFGSIAGVFEASKEDLMEVKGVGETTAAFLNSIPQITRAYINSRWGDKPKLLTRREMRQYCVSLMMGRTNETYAMIILDNQHRVMYTGIISEGDRSHTSANNTRILELVIRHKAQQIVITHNHPGGSLKASAADRVVTDSLVEMLRPLGVCLLDHVIVAGEQTFSMYEARMINY